MLTVSLASLPPNSDPAFPLEDGPIAPLDGDALTVTTPPVEFTGLVAGEIGNASGGHAAIDAAHDTIAAASDPAPFANDTGGAIGEAAGAADAHTGALGSLDPGSLVDQAASKGAQAGAQIGVYDEPAPGDVTPPDAGPPPGRGDDNQNPQV